MAPRGVRKLAGTSELFQCVGARTVSNRRQRVGGAEVDALTERLGHETGQVLDDRLTASLRAAHGLGRLVYRTRREDSKVTQQPLLVLRQQLVAPVECGSQRPVPRDGGAAPFGQQRRSDRAGRRLPFDGQIALHKAAQNGHVEIVAELIARGSDPYLADKNGATAHSLAQEHGQEAVLQVLSLVIPGDFDSSGREPSKERSIVTCYQ